MSQFASVPEHAARESASEASPRFTTDARRWPQLALAALWVLDALLQFQAYMFTGEFATQILAGAAHGNPGWIADSILWMAGMVERNPVATNAAFAVLQLAIGLGLAWRHTVRVALAASIMWALLVWWFGEGLGSLLVGTASPLTGTPGAALLYAILAVLLWPTAHQRVGTCVASRTVGKTISTMVWVVLWGGLGALNLQAANLTAGAIRSDLAGMGDGQPGWLTSLIDGFATLAARDGTILTVIGTGILFLIAAGIFLPRKGMRVVVAAAVIVSAFIWVIGEALGAPFGGHSTDVNSAPLLALIALAYWPTPGHPRVPGAEAPA
jgi:hypothetical protein